MRSASAQRGALAKRRRSPEQPGRETKASGVGDDLAERLAVILLQEMARASDRGARRRETTAYFAQSTERSSAIASKGSTLTRAASRWTPASTQRPSAPSAKTSSVRAIGSTSQACRTPSRA